MDSSPIEPPALHHLRAAEGWLELGNCHEATCELAAIEAALQNHYEVLEMRWRISAQSLDWENCAKYGYALVEVAPDEVQSWIHRSFALHELKRTQEAYDLLLAAASLFRTHWLVLYNLACYECQLGNLQAAREWLAAAFSTGDAKSLKAMAMADEDLAPLRSEIARM